MLELTGIASVLRALGVLYWAVAIAAVATAIYWPKGRARKLAVTAAVLVVFGALPVKNWLDARDREAYAREAWAHFKKLCAEKSGEKIYKTYTGVKSVLVVKPLPPATEKDLFDQFWYGDPYTNATPWKERAESAASSLTGNRKFLPPYDKWEIGYDYIEIRRVGDSHPRFERLTPLTTPPFRQLAAIEKPVSRFGISWEDISTPGDRRYWIAGSRLRVIDLLDNTIVAERIGYLIEAGFGSKAGGRRPWLASRRGSNLTCPLLTNGDFEDRWFVLKVLQVSGEVKSGK